MFQKLKNRDSTRYLVVDHTLTRPSIFLTKDDIEYRDKQAGYFGIRYHYVIRRDGVIETGRPLDKQSPVSRIAPASSITVIMVGGRPEDTEETGTEDNFTVQQKTALLSLLDDVMEEHPDIKMKTVDDFFNRGQSKVSLSISKLLSRY